MRFSRIQAGQGLCLALVTSISAYALSPVPTGKPSAFPDWWFERDVIPRLPAYASTVPPTLAWPSHYPVADDYAAFNIGQLKFMATQAAAEMDAKIPSDAGAGVTGLLAGWASSTNRDDYAVVNLGQLKVVSVPFYDRLYDVGLRLFAGGKYPWSGSSSAGDDYALANLGQLKLSFSFTVPTSMPVIGFLDSDSDGIHDAWESWHLGNLTAANATSNADGDALTDAAESRVDTDPNTAATAVSSASLALVVYSP